MFSATSQPTSSPGEQPQPIGAIRYALLLLGVVFLLRIFYADYVWADEGLWFTAANELLRGKSLYSQIWFDKPPALAWTYAALFRLFGASILTVRLFTIFYATGVCLALWHIGRRFWGAGEGRLAALLYAIYNATYIHSQVQPMAVDQLMLLPYLYSGYFFLTGRPFWCGLLAAVAFSLNPKAATLLLFFVVVAVAARAVRPEAAPGHTGGGRHYGAAYGALLAAGFVIALAPGAAYLLTGDRWHYYVRDFWGWGFSYVTVYSPRDILLNGLRRTLNYAGFHISLVIGALGTLASCRRVLFSDRAATEASRADDGYPSSVSGLREGAVPGAVARDPRVNKEQNTLPNAESAAAHGARRQDASAPRPASTPEPGPWNLDPQTALWLWLAVSFLGVAAGGRFFPRYFYQVLPLLCLLAARGYVLCRGPKSKVQDPVSGAARGAANRAAARSVPACRDAGGRGSHDNRDSLQASGPRPSAVEQRPRQAVEGSDSRGEEARRSGGNRALSFVRLRRTLFGLRLCSRRFAPRPDSLRSKPALWALLFWLGILFSLVRFHHRAAYLAYEKLTGRQTAYMAAWADPAISRDSRVIAQRVHGSLFVWGYRPEIYFFCGCEAASSYLSDQPLTGVPADIHLREARSVAPERAAEDRKRLLAQLGASMPDYIVDGLGPYNPALAMEQYPELREFLRRHYVEAERIGQGIIYRSVRQSRD